MSPVFYGGTLMPAWPDAGGEDWLAKAQEILGSHLGLQNWTELLPTSATASPAKIDAYDNAPDDRWATGPRAIKVRR